MMYGYQCVKCGNYWCCQAAPGQDFVALTKWCPFCLPTVCPQVNLGKVRTAL